MRTLVFATALTLACVPSSAAPPPPKLVSGGTLVLPPPLPHIVDRLNGDRWAQWSDRTVWRPVPTQGTAYRCFQRTTQYGYECACSDGMVDVLDPRTCRDDGVVR